MLAVPAPFPHIGSTAYLRGTGAPARILQRNADDTCTVELLRRTPAGDLVRAGQPGGSGGASGNRRVEAGDLYATEREAVFCGRPPKGRSPRRPR